MPGGHLRDNLWIRSVPSEYSPAQLVAYLERIRWQPNFTEEDIGVGRFPRSVDTLAKVVLGHLTTFSWDNTDMHYTQDHHMAASPQGAYDRLMNKGRGSYCFGMNTILLQVLRGLGFRAYSGQARVNQNWSHGGAAPSYASHTHMVIFVQPEDGSNETYIVDVGFGNGGCIRPIPLVEGQESVTQGIGPVESQRLVKRGMPKSALAKSLEDPLSEPGQALWALQIFSGDRTQATEEQWRTKYTFSELEFFPADAIDGSSVVEHSTDGFFATNVVAVKVFAESDGATNDGDPKLHRKILFGSEVKKHGGDGHVEVIRTLRSEQDRVEALREVFGIELDADASRYIRDRAAFKA